MTRKLPLKYDEYPHIRVCNDFILTKRMLVIQGYTEKSLKTPLVGGHRANEYLISPEIIS
jgi:hypothetical protein